ncbi:pathogenesis-related protein 1A-like [Olea europaea var. sylvestris]|uniref:pathogenesis-related protein 1A-like n=1 Tax=Olea europaea var. sylvestris TaxID=158386 RepID=UPI000C1D5E1D|nr:pathogenesis-related protein 1A-like [Olea europaea var. sylvestris]
MTMALLKIFFFLLCFIMLSLLVPSHAQNSNQDYVNAHNTPRGQVGVGVVTWNTTLETYAQNYANQRKGDCNLVHSYGPYGENLAKGSASSFTGTAAVNLWVAEKQYYNYGSNTCATGQQCGHYTQVVWRDSVRIGCARVSCNNGWYYVICSYDPPGNWQGEWPY